MGGDWAADCQRSALWPYQFRPSVCYMHTDWELVTAPSPLGRFTPGQIHPWVVPALGSSSTSSQDMNSEGVFCVAVPVNRRESPSLSSCPVPRRNVSPTYWPYSAAPGCSQWAGRMANSWCPWRVLINYSLSAHSLQLSSIPNCTRSAPLIACGGTYSSVRPV